MTADELFETVVASLITQPAVTTAKMFGSPGLRVGKKVFACLVKGKLVVKLSQERVGALVAAGEAERFDPGMGRLMKEWAAIAPRSTDAWLGLAQESKEFVAGIAARV